MKKKRVTPPVPKEELEVFDNHSIKDDFEELKRLMESSYDDMDKVLYNKGKNAIMRVRKNLKLISNKCLYLRKSLSYQRQDNDVDN
jgi:hypothetical protein